MACTVKSRCPCSACLIGKYSGKVDLNLPEVHGLAEPPDALQDGPKKTGSVTWWILTQKAFLVVERELKLTGFWESIPARNKLKAELQLVLLSPEFLKLPGLVNNRAQVISRVMEIAEKNNDIILYSE